MDRHISSIFTAASCFNVKQAIAAICDNYILQDLTPLPLLPIAPCELAFALGLKELIPLPLEDDSFRNLFD